MATPEPALRSIREPHIHALGETCPMCDQPIPNDKAEEVRARMETQERSAALVANTRADQQIAAEKARIEAAAGAKFEELRKEKEEALEKAAADAAVRAEAALAEGRKGGAAARRRLPRRTGTQGAGAFTRHLPRASNHGSRMA